MSAITLALEAFIKLAERIIRLEKTKLESRQKLFDQLVKPLFLELEPVASNYIGYFRKARQSIRRSKDGDFREVAELIKEERDAMSMARIKVREMAKQIKENIDDPDIVAFAASVDKFFYSAPRFPQVQDVPGSTSSSAMRFLDYLRFASLNNIGTQEVVNHLDVVVNSIEQDWSLVVQCHEKVRIKSIAPKKVKKKKKTRAKKSK